VHVRVAVVVIVLFAHQARAQTIASDTPPPAQVVCDECVKGDAELDALGPSGNALRAYAPQMIEEWVPLKIEGELTPLQEATLRDKLDTRVDLHEAIHALRKHSDEQLLQIGHALCKGPAPECARYLAAALDRVRHIERGYIPEAHHMPYGLPHPEQGCDPYVRQVKSPKLGFGFEYASGWQASEKPVDGRVWSLGLEARARLAEKLGMVARVDRSKGRDEAIDNDGDGRDDAYTGAVTRWTALVGPSFRLSIHRAREGSRYWQVDSLVGLSRAGDQSGLVTGLDLSYQFVVARVGARVLQGFGDAGDESALLVHAGFMFGAGPTYSYGAGCGVETRPRGSAWAIAMDVPLFGYAHGVGYITPAFGLEAALHVKPRFDLIVRGDLLDMPSGDDDRALHSSVLAGGRVDFSGKAKRTRTGFFATLAAGYAHVATTSSADIQSGPVVDASLGWGGQGSDGAAYLRLHGRFGVTEDNRELRAVFLSAGAELRLDRDRWRDRL
jgi:hypothetical protein